MAHTVEVTMIADQYIRILGEEVNVNDLDIIEVNEFGCIIGCVTKCNDNNIDLIMGASNTDDSETKIRPDEQLPYIRGA